MFHKGMLLPGYVPPPQYADHSCVGSRRGRGSPPPHNLDGSGARLCSCLHTPIPWLTESPASVQPPHGPLHPDPPPSLFPFNSGTPPPSTFSYFITKLGILSFTSHPPPSLHPSYFHPLPSPPFLFLTSRFLNLN